MKARKTIFSIICGFQPQTDRLPQLAKARVESITIFIIFGLFCWSLGHAHAYSSDVYTNLTRTRDALLDQRSHLTLKANDLKQKMDEYGRQLDLVNGYLRDTDRAIKDVDDAMRRAR